MREKGERIAQNETSFLRFVMLWGMRPLEKLTFEAIVARLRTQFESLEREERVAKFNYPLS